MYRDFYKVPKFKENSDKVAIEKISVVFNPPLQFYLLFYNNNILLVYSGIFIKKRFLERYRIRKF